MSAETRPELVAGHVAATRGSVIRLGAEAVARVLGLATALLMSVGLGVEGFGVFSALSAAAALLAQLANFGIQEIAVPALIAGRLSLGAMVRTRALLTASVLAIVGVTSATLWWRAPSGEAGAMVILAVLVATSATNGWIEFLGVTLRAHGRPLEEAFLLVSVPALALAAVAGALKAGAGTLGVAIALGMASLPALCVGGYRVATSNGSATTAARAPAQNIGAVLKEAWPLAVNGGLALLSLRVELLALAAMRGPRDAGLFALALKIVESANAAAGAVSAGALPALTREALAPAARHARTRTAGMVAVLAVPAAAALALLAPRLLEQWGRGYEDAGPVLRVLGLALVPMFLNAALLHSLIAVGRAPWLPALTALRTAAAAVAAPLLARQGAEWAAAGFVGAECLLLVAAGLACRRALFPVPILVPLAAGTAVAIPTVLAIRFAGGGLPLPLAAGALAWLLALGALWWLSTPSRRPHVGYP